ncbi:MAG: hypothetical protein AB7P20_19645 [Rhizobiaceae bacterium]
MTASGIDGKGIARLRGLAEVLIPEHDVMPGAGSVQDFDLWLERAIRASGYSPEELQAAIAALPARIDWNGAKALSRTRPDDFIVLGRLISAAYYMAPDVLGKLGFPSDRRDPAGAEDFAAELETGLFEKMLSEPPRFRDTR